MCDVTVLLCGLVVCSRSFGQRTWLLYCVQCDIRSDREAILKIGCVGLCLFNHMGWREKMFAF